MSGPKHCSYSVSANAARIRREREARMRRERQAATAAANKLATELEELIQSINGVDPDAALKLRTRMNEEQSLRGSHEQILALPGKLEGIRQECQRTLGKHMAELEAARNFKSASAEVGEHKARKEADAKAAIAKWREPLLERLAAIHDGAKGKLRKRVQSVISLAQKDNPDKVSLQSDVMALEGRRREQEAQAERAGQLAIGLAGFDDREAKALTARLAEVEAGERDLDDKLVQRVEKATVELREKEDRRYVAQVLADGFRELGYDVAEGFETAFDKGDAVQFSHAEREGYAVEINFEAKGIAFDAELVRTEDNSHLTAEERDRRDVTAERSWCNDLAKVTSGARANGIVGKAKAKRRIGAQPVRSVVTGSQRKSSSSTARKNRQSRAIKP